MRTAIRGVLTMNIANLNRSAAAPAGVAVRVDLGDLEPWDVRQQDVHMLAYLAQNAGSIEVTGTHPGSVEKVVRDLPALIEFEKVA